MTARSTRTGRFAAALISLAGLCFASPAQAQDDAFRRGIEAGKKEDWDIVVVEMRAALQARPQESATKVQVSRLERVSNLGGTEYLPHFFLGQAFFKLGDCAEATTQWGASEQQGVVRSLPAYLKLIQNGYAECEKKGVLPPSKYDAAVARTLQQVNDVNVLATTVSSLGQANLDIWRADQNIREQYERASTEIQAARARYLAGRASRAVRDFADASAAADRARAILTTVETGLNAAIETQRSAQVLARDVGEAIGAAEALDRAIEAKPRTLEWTPGLTTTRREGRDAIVRARERFNEGLKTLNPPTLTAARTLAQDASTRLKQVFDELTGLERETTQKQLGGALAQALDSFSLLDTAVATLNRFSAERPAVLSTDKAAEREAAQRQAALAKRRFESARKSDNVKAIVDAAQLASELKDRLNALIGEFGPLTIRDRGVHPLLEEGARLFFAGEYQQVVSALEPAEGFESNVPLRVHVHLFRAAALYELFLKSHEADQSLRAQAAAEVEHCRTVDPAFQPDVRAFSPRFIAFYRSAAGTASAVARASQ